MNKLLLTLKRDWNEDIIVVANNHKDLESYLRKEFDFYKVEMHDDFVSIIERQGFTPEQGDLKWIIHV